MLFCARAAKVGRIIGAAASAFTLRVVGPVLLFSAMNLIGTPIKSARVAGAFTEMPISMALAEPVTDAAGMKLSLCDL